jgi:hypothetical protein
MSELYQLALMGAPTDAQVGELEAIVRTQVEMFNLHLGSEVGWVVRPAEFNPDQRQSSAAVFFGGNNPPLANIASLLKRGIPVLPVPSDIVNVSTEIPEVLRPLNCLGYNEGAVRVATALLECAGLLPRQRRVFVSYRRNEAREAALQLFDVLSARLFDVFLDTHGIPPAEDFQAMLWHRLCDSDVLVMLDTPSYFGSRWTEAEYGRALSKGITVLRVGWPGFTPSKRVATASRVDLTESEIDLASGRIADQALDRICKNLEQVRSRSIAVRTVNLVSNLRIAIETIGGQVIGVGPSRAVHVRLADDRPVVVYPTVGVPTSSTLHDASLVSPDQKVAVVYDHVGLDPKWQGHLDWLGGHVATAKWIKSAETAWQFADWQS